MGLKIQGRVAASRYFIIASFVLAFTLLPLRTLVFSLPAFAESAAVPKPKVNNIALSAPKLVAPNDNAIKNGSRLDFDYSWQAVEGAKEYVYESYTDEALQGLHEKQIVTETTFVPKQVQPHGSSIWWRVKAVSAADETSDWSPVRKVIIDNEAPTIQNVTEGDMSKVSKIAIFKFAVKDNYPDKIIASMDGALTPASQATEEVVLAGPAATQTQFVTVRLAINLDTLALNDGPHLLTVRATDHAGNLSDAVHVNFNVANAAPVPEENAPPAPVASTPEIQPISMPQSAPIAPILGGERVEATDVALVDGAVTKADTQTVKDMTPINAHDHPAETPHVNFGWPMWLGFGAFLSGTGWWVLSGRKRA